MSNPLALLPLAMAAGGGRIGAFGAAPESGFEAQQLVAAGFTLLQRSAPLVRALSGRRSAILLGPSPAFVTALAASEGRGAVLLDPLDSAGEIALRCSAGNVGAIFTTSHFLGQLPPAFTAVLLDELPRAAQVVMNGAAREVDLGSHHGLDLAGERDVPGSDEEAVLIFSRTESGEPLAVSLTHAAILTDARLAIDAMGYRAGDHVLAQLPCTDVSGLVIGGVAPLLAGARVTTFPRHEPVKVSQLLESDATHIVAGAAVFQALLHAVQHSALDLRGGALRHCTCGDETPTPSLEREWLRVTGVELNGNRMNLSTL